MAEPLEIKHKEPALRQMAADYRIMFSGSNLKLMLFWCGLFSILVVGWFVTPSSLDPSRNIVLRVLAFIDAYFLFGFGALFALSLVSPLLAHFVLPLVIMLLEIPRMLLFGIQYLIDQLLIEELIGSFFYPTPDEKTTPDA
jgi:hypothetical protein